MDFRQDLAESVAGALGAEDAGEVYASFEIPPNPDMGDFAFPCFRLAKELKKAPPVIAKELSERLAVPAFVDEVRVTGAYLNFFVNKAVYVGSVVARTLAEGDGYGRSEEGRGRNVVVEYSSPNIAKPFHIGHLRSTVIGQALFNMHEFLGYNTTSVNHLGDWGTQFGKMIAAFKKWGVKEEVEAGGVAELSRLYVLFHQEAEKEPALDEEARGWFLKMQNGDEDALALWKWFVDISLAEFERVYELLNVRFHHYTGESFYSDKMDAVVEELRSKNLLMSSDGAMIVDLEDYGMPPCLILRSDGGTLYPTRDLATALYRKKTFEFHKSLYVVAVDQSLHFSQFFKVIELMGHEWAKELVHVPFGLVSLESGKLSTRKGNVVLLEELLNEAVKRARDIIEEKNPELADRDKAARQVGIGAVIFNDLYNSRIKDITFSFQRALSFEGETGPYVQYTHARAASVLAKAGAAAGELSGADFSLITDDASYDTAKLIGLFGDKVREAVQKLEPYVVTRYLVDVAQSFNRFYHDNSVLGSADDVKRARLALVFCVKTVLKNGLGLLGIDAPDKM